MRRDDDLSMSFALAPAIVELAGAACRPVMKIYRRNGIGHENKSDGSPLTEADLAADRVIADGLRRLDPDTPILSEEAVGPTMRATSRFWCVDPLDGTRDFLSRNGEFTINIALVVDGLPVFGVVAAPALPGDPCWWGGPALGGSWRREGPDPPAAIRCADLPPAGGRLRIVASRSHRDQATEAWIAALGRPVDLVASGSSLKLCQVADGRAHAYPRFGPTNAWDIAAGHAVVLGAGGEVRRSDGGVLAYDAGAPLNPAFIATCRGF